MAKLFDVETGDKKKNSVIKGAFLFLVLATFIFAALMHSYVKRDDYVEDTTYSQICVHVKGAVEESGIYYVPFGTRVNDLQKYVGGFLPNADLDGVNLAEYVKDGNEVYIPFKGSAETGGYDLNAVTLDEMVENIDGIGETYAKKIIAYRDSHGGFTSVNELKAIVGDSVYEKVREKFYISEK